MRPHQPTPTELAVIVIILIQRYAAERGKDISRIRLARTSLRRLAIRSRLHDTFVNDWIDIMAEYGWLVLVVSDDEILLMKEEITRSWTKIGTKRCDDIIKRLRSGDNTVIDEAEQEIDQSLDAGDESEEED